MHFFKSNRFQIGLYLLLVAVVLGLGIYALVIGEGYRRWGGGAAVVLSGFMIATFYIRVTYLANHKAAKKVKLSKYEHHALLPTQEQKIAAQSYGAQLGRQYREKLDRLLGKK